MRPIDLCPVLESSETPPSARADQVECASVLAEWRLKPLQRRMYDVLRKGPNILDRNPFAACQTKSVHSTGTLQLSPERGLYDDVNTFGNLLAVSFTTEETILAVCDAANMTVEQIMEHGIPENVRSQFVAENVKEAPELTDDKAILRAMLVSEVVPAFLQEFDKELTEEERISMEKTAENIMSAMTDTPAILRAMLVSEIVPKFLQKFDKELTEEERISMENAAENVKEAPELTDDQSAVQVMLASEVVPAFLQEFDKELTEEERISMEKTAENVISAMTAAVPKRLLGKYVPAKNENTTTSSVPSQDVDKTPEVAEIATKRPTIHGSSASCEFTIIGGGRNGSM